MDIYSKTTFKTAQLFTKSYSTSFYSAVNMLEKDLQMAIFGIYGFVRLADEIVDTFHNYNKEKLLNKFESDLKEAIAERISTNPVLHAFQQVVNVYDIPYELIDAFMLSMKADLNKKSYTNKDETEQYIYGSANVVGLMCLKIFTRESKDLYEELKLPAMKLGSAFQKVNFLRDLKTDMHDLQRTYFCNCRMDSFDEQAKNVIVDEIKIEFLEAYKGIRSLPGRSRLAVLTAYLYYSTLLKKIENTPSSQILHVRVRISNFRKTLLLMKAMFLYKFKMI
ncbi:MAG: phytoene/squalene synthase family protein [Paludibacter sp.]|nr:phytoene/squalene synthase family protein [Paludibacter sp.]MDD4199157.1 phytoene/squalene synthase family protein [Paludibacter sp.]MDD4427789.1 phytoene/squalene synthase family protein [Paludibacter sp.]